MTLPNINAKFEQAMSSVCIKLSKSEMEAVLRQSVGADIQGYTAGRVWFDVNRGFECEGCTVELVREAPGLAIARGILAASHAAALDEMRKG